MSGVPGPDAVVRGDFETALADSDLLEIRVWLRLLTCTNLVERRIRRNPRAKFDITLPRFDLLAQLHRAPEGLTMGALSRRLMVSNGNVTGLIERRATGLVPPGSRRVHLKLAAEAGEGSNDGYADGLSLRLLRRR